MSFTPCRLAGALRRDQSGSTLVEFALLAPAFLTLMFGIMQVGVHMQNYNAVRNLAADGARFAVVSYQKGNQLSATSIQAEVFSRGVRPKYGLNGNRLEVTVDPITDSADIAGIKETTIHITYDAPDFLGDLVPGGTLDLAYERPVFLLPA